MTRLTFAWWSPEALAMSLHLAFLIGLHDAGNDNGSGRLGLSNEREPDGEGHPEPVGDPHEGLHGDVLGTPLDAGVVLRVHPDHLGDPVPRDSSRSARTSNVLPKLDDPLARPRGELAGHADNGALADGTRKESYRTLVERARMGRGTLPSPTTRCGTRHGERRGRS